MVITALLIGLFTGVLSGLLGVGGGIIIVPAMVLLLGTSQHVAQGVSLAVIIPTAIVGVINCHRHGYVNYRVAALLAVGAVTGALLSSLFVNAIPGLVLKKIFGVFLGIMGIQMIRQAEPAQKITRGDAH